MSSNTLRSHALLLTLTGFWLPLASDAQHRGAMDSVRIRDLYVSNRPEDHPVADYERDMNSRRRSDSIWAARSRGVMDYRKVTYKSTADGMEIPAHVFEPLQKRGAKGHAAMIWVHGGVHSNFGTTMYPFVREAVQRGYVIIAPDYRGSTGYGKAHHNAIDYGGKEVTDAMSAVEYLKTLPHIDQDRLGMMGWSHGGFITSLSIMRDAHPFKGGAAIVPVTNLFFRLSYKGPSYTRSFSTQAGIQGMPHEQRAEYEKRSPLYQVEKLNVPILVHVSTNDEDVNYVEDQQMVWKLRALKPELAETRVYVDPAPWGSSVGHAFSRRVDPTTLERVDSPDQIDSWNRTWAFFDWILRPYEDRSKPLPECWKVDCQRGRPVPPTEFSRASRATVLPVPLGLRRGSSSTDEAREARVLRSPGSSLLTTKAPRTADSRSRDAQARTASTRRRTTSRSTSSSRTTCSTSTATTTTARTRVYHS